MVLSPHESNLLQLQLLQHKAAAQTEPAQTNIALHTSCSKGKTYSTAVVGLL